MRVDRDRVGQLEARDAAAIALGEAGRRPVRRVDVEPQALGVGRASASGSIRSTEPVFVEPATAEIATGVRPAARSRAIAAATGSGWRRNRSSVGRTTSVSAGKPSSSSARAIEKWVWSDV